MTAVTFDKFANYNDMVNFSAYKTNNRPIKFLTCIGKTVDIFK